VFKFYTPVEYYNTSAHVPVMLQESIPPPGLLLQFAGKHRIGEHWRQETGGDRPIEMDVRAQPSYTHNGGEGPAEYFLRKG
jgi:hypothetical protein